MFLNKYNFNIILQIYCVFLFIFYLAGWAGYRFGFKKLLFYSSLIGAMINLAYPIVVRMSFPLGVVLRIFLGISHSGSSTAMTEAWSKWAPAAEKSFLLNIIFSGMSTGKGLKNNFRSKKLIVNFSKFLRQSFFDSKTFLFE